MLRSSSLNPNARKVRRFAVSSAQIVSRCSIDRFSKLRRSRYPRHDCWLPPVSAVCRARRVARNRCPIRDPRVSGGFESRPQGSTGVMETTTWFALTPPTSPENWREGQKTRRPEGQKGNEV